MTTPVTWDAASLHSHSAACAASSGLPMRPAGTIPTKPFNTASIFAVSPPTAWLTALCNNSVSKPPATNAFTRIPSAAYSCAADLVRPKIPALDIEYRAPRHAPIHDSVADILTVRYVFTIVVGASYQTLARFSRL